MPACTHCCTRAIPPMYTAPRSHLCAVDVGALAGRRCRGCRLRCHASAVFGGRSHRTRAGQPRRRCGCHRRLHHRSHRCTCMTCIKKQVHMYVMHRTMCRNARNRHKVRNKTAGARRVLRCMRVLPRTASDMVLVLVCDRN